MISRNRALLLLASLCIGCGWSNSMYWARRYSNDAIAVEKSGRPFEAQILWGQVINKADSAWARSGETKYEARLYRGIANARLGNCVASVPDLESAVPQMKPGAWFDRGQYELGRCDQKLKLPGAETHLRGLLSNPDHTVRMNATLVLADVYLDAGRWSDILTLLPIEEHPALRFARAVAHVGMSELPLARQEAAPLLAINDTSVAWQRLIEELAKTRSGWTDSLLDQINAIPKIADVTREYWYLAGVQGAVQVGDTVAAKARIASMLKLAPTSLLDQAQLLLVEYRMSRVASIDDLAGVVRALPPAGAEDGGPNTRILRLRRTAEQLLSEVDSLSGVPLGDLRLFAAAEDANEVLNAPALERTLLQRLDRDWPQSPYVVKGLLRRITNEPDSADKLRARLASYPANAYVMVIQLKSDSLFGHLEDSLANFIRLRANAIFARGNVTNHGPGPE